MWYKSPNPKYHSMWMIVKDKLISVCMAINDCAIYEN